MASVSDIESVDWDRDRYTQRPQIYVIASQPRCGSHYLAQLLRSTDQAGVPLEYFHTKHWKRWVKRCGQSNPLSAFRILCQLRTTPNGVFGVKAHWRQFQMACRLRLEDEFSGARFIQITRQDLLGQAISLVIASQTGSWIHDRKPDRAPDFSFTAIQAAIGQLLAERSGWDRFFATTGIEPLRISYEDLVADVDSTMERVAAHIGIDWAPVGGEVEVRVQRTELSDQWRERFLTTLPQLHDERAFWRNEFGLATGTHAEADLT